MASHEVLDSLVLRYASAHALVKRPGSVTVTTKALKSVGQNIQYSCIYSKKQYNDCMCLKTSSVQIELNRRDMLGGFPCLFDTKVKKHDQWRQDHLASKQKTVLIADHFPTAT